MNNDGKKKRVRGTYNFGKTAKTKKAIVKLTEDSRYRDLPGIIRLQSYTDRNRDNKHLKGEQSWELKHTAHIRLPEDR